jgi:tetratricopeptide (TPR) repeat protein
MVGPGDESSGGDDEPSVETARRSSLDEAATPHVTVDWMSRATVTEVEPAVDRALTQALLDWTTPPNPVPAPQPKTSLARPPSILPPPNTSGARVIDPRELAEIYVERAMKRQDEGDHDGAYADYTKAIERAPGHLLATYNRGVSALALGRHTEALGDFAQALQINGSLAEASFNAALALLALDKPADAALFAEHAATCYQARGDAEMADRARSVIERSRLNDRPGP